ncbi:MAG TPA: xanthine dehydrogenase family protein molybdopterin-binding subunit [Candidatus Acidoferrales bacterium]|nr:xanthine dehydrogenase family protein molybdopterin-binding subunit [Candidatus Acidoferrales bacterium]
MKLHEHFSAVGIPTIRSDGEPKVTGATRYTADYTLPGIIWGKCLRSPFSHARIRGIDVERAKKIKGVFAILTAADLPAQLTGIVLKDMPVLASGRVRFVGERVAVVGAESPEIAEDALSRIEVDYEELPAVHDPLEAMAAGAPIIHESLRNYAGLQLPLPEIPNLHSYVQWQKGNHEQGFAESDLVLEQTFKTQRVHQGYLEPHAAIVQIDSSDRILIRAPAKQPYVNKQHLAGWLGLDPEKVVFQIGFIGGDFGGKNTLMDIPLCYYLAKTTGRPVKMIMSYAEELSTANPRHASIIAIKTGVKKDGRLWARELKAVFNGGAYAGIKENATCNLPGARHGNGSYSIPHSMVQSFAVYTNCIPGGIMRGPGDLQVNFAVESHMDYVARQLGMDAYEFRRMNVLKRGDPLLHGPSLNGDMGVRVLESLGQKLRSAATEKKKPYVGRGFALASRDINAGEANIEVALKEDGKAHILTTVSDTGTGAHTIFRQIVAEALKISPKEVEVNLGTTDTFPIDVRVIASLVTYLGGHAVHQAAFALRDQVVETAAAHFQCSPEDIELARGNALGPRKRTVPLSDLAVVASARNKPLIARGTMNVKERVGAVCFFAQAAEVEVDPETGQLKVRKIISAHDVGTIINPLTHAGQVEGGMLQGFGFALTENLPDEEGKILTNNLGEYKLPNIQDIPKHETLYVRDNDGPGPFQAKPIGEHGAIPTAAAIANAVYDAIGVQITDLPITAEKIYRALQAERMRGELAP